MEFEDKNLKAVIKKAAKVFKVPEEKLKYEVISYGSTGIFGLVGAKKAKIRVVTSTTEKEVQKKKSPKAEAPGKVKPAKRPAEKKRIEKPKIEKITEEKSIAAEDDGALETEEAVELGHAVLKKILDKISEDATVRIEKNDEGVVYHVEGGKSAIIIGKRGQTLEAIQYLVDRVVNKSSERRIRLQVDVAGYLENKKLNLEQRALHLAEKVQKTGKPATVGELNVYDRKSVHVCLKEIQGVRTQSMGAGFYRKLVIFPKKENNSNKQKTSND